MIRILGFLFWATFFSLSAVAATEWYYSDGLIVSPHIKQEDHILLMSEAGRISVQVRVYFVDREPLEFTQTVGDDLPTHLELHKKPEWSRFSSYGVRLRSDKPFLVQSTKGFFRDNDEYAESMTSVLPLRGPLSGRQQEWTYVDSIVLRKDTWAENELVMVLNPNKEPATVTVTALTSRFRLLPGMGTTAKTFTIPPERELVVDLQSLPHVPTNGYLFPKIKSDRPIVVQQIRYLKLASSPVPHAIWSLFPLSSEP